MTVVFGASPWSEESPCPQGRADIWAFGCVLFEMLTGKRAFAGDDVSDVLASVLARSSRYGINSMSSIDRMGLAPVDTS